MNTFDIRPLTALDQAWLPDFFTTHWGSTRQVVRTLFVPHELPGFVAGVDGTVIGLVTYRQLDTQTAEVGTLNSLSEGIGIGRALVQAVMVQVSSVGCTRLVVVTTE